MSFFKEHFFISFIAIILMIILLMIFYWLYMLGIIGIGPLKSIGLKRKPIKLTESIYEYESHEFKTAVDNQKIIGTLFLPKADKPFNRILIFSHGFSSSAAILAPKAKFFHKLVFQRWSMILEEALVPAKVMAKLSICP